MRSVLAILLLASLSVAVKAHETAELPAALAEKVEVARRTCADVQGGDFALAWGAVTRVDLDGDLQPDWVLDESAYACSSAVNLFCSTGGCVSHFMVGDIVGSFRNQGWTVVTLGHSRVLLTRANGSVCGGLVATPCFVARVWDSKVRSWSSVEGATD